MKTLMQRLLFLLAFIAGTTHLLAENVSTGTDGNGNAVAPGTLDANGWYIMSGPTPMATYRVASYGPYWQQTPIPGMQGCWINGTGTIFSNPPGIYTFERDFNITGASSFTTNFGVAWDDILVSLELVGPGGSPVIPLSVPPAAPYTVSPMINYTVNAPVSGNWTIRAVVNFVDNVGAFILSGTVEPCPAVLNISTAVDDNGNSIAIGAVDPYWLITAGPGGPETRREPSFTGFWQPTPISGTNAGWIDYTGTWNDPAGIKTFSRSFYIGPNTCNFTTNFQISWDDNLTGLRLVPPSGPPIPLSAPTPVPYYWLTTPIVHSESMPMAGTWKIEADVNFVDQLGGFILSGYVNTDCCASSQCTCEDLVPDFSYYNTADCITRLTGTVNADCYFDVDYIWKVNGTVVGAGQTFDYAFPANGTYNVCLITRAIIDGQVCEKEVCHDVVIQCNPCDCKDLKLEFGGYVDGCEGYFQGLAWGSSCMQHFDYWWTVNGVTVGGGQTLNYTFPSNGTYQVCMHVRTYLPDGTICEDKFCRDYEVKDCKPNACCEQMQVEFGGHVDKCQGYFQGQAWGSPCFTSYDYWWTVNGTTVGAGQTLSYTFTADGNYVVCLHAKGTMADGTVCEKEFCTTYNVKGCNTNPCCEQMQLEFNGHTDACYGFFQGKAWGPSCLTNFDYWWTVNGVPAGTGPSLTYTFPNNGSYVICMHVKSVLPDGTICEKELCRNYNVTGCVEQCDCNALIVDFTTQVNGCNGFFGSNVSAPPCMLASGYLKYDWFVNNYYVGSGSAIGYGFPCNGTYKVCLMVTGMLPNGILCERKTCYDVVITQCGNCGPTTPAGKLLPYDGSQDIDQEFILYPNPTDGWAIVEHPASVREIQVYNIVGELLFTVTPEAGKPTKVDLSGQPKGMYMLKAEGMMSKQLIKQ